MGETPIAAMQYVFSVGISFGGINDLLRRKIPFLDHLEIKGKALIHLFALVISIVIRWVWILFTRSQRVKNGKLPP